MAFYSDQNVRTRILDPRIYVPGARATFELDASEAAYLPNLRLGLVGVTSAGNSYNRLLGTQALIRSIRLLDGKQEQLLGWLKLSMLILLLTLLTLPLLI